MTHRDIIANGYPKSYEKWGIDVVKSGYTLIPNVFLEMNLFLDEKSKLNAAELAALIIILSNWRDPHKKPAASKKYIAERLDLSTRQVQRILTSLAAKGVLFRQNGGEKTGGASVFDIRRVLAVMKSIFLIKSRRAQAEGIKLEFHLKAGNVTVSAEHPEFSFETNFFPRDRTDFESDLDKELDFDSHFQMTEVNWDNGDDPNSLSQILERLLHKNETGKDGTKVDPDEDGLQLPVSRDKY